MKFLLVTVTLVLLLEGGWATNIFDDAKGDINSILVCGRGQPPLIAINPDDFSPTQSTFARRTFPGGYPSVPTMSMLLNGLGNDFDIRVQALSRFSLPSATFGLPSPVCPPTNRSDEIDYTQRIQDRYIALGETGIPLEIRETVSTLFGFLECLPASGWVDAGDTFFPRMFLNGACVTRRCSLPDRPNFLCRPDLTFRNEAVIHSYRWDCCHMSDDGKNKPAADGMEGMRDRDFRCGWRRVRVPVVCDCDCSCGITNEIPAPPPVGR